MLPGQKLNTPNSGNQQLSIFVVCGLLIPPHNFSKFDPFKNRHVVVTVHSQQLKFANYSAVDPTYIFSRKRKHEPERFQMPQCSSVPTTQRPSVPASQPPNLLISHCLIVTFTNVEVSQCPSLQSSEFSNVPDRQYPNVQMSQCPSLPISQCPSDPVPQPCSPAISQCISLPMS